MTQHWTQHLFNRDYLQTQAKFSSRQTAKECDLIVQHLGLTVAQTVLDLACGHGRHSLELARRGFSVLGLDASPDAIAKARLVHSKAEFVCEAVFVCEDFCSLKYEAQFDAVFNVFDSLFYYNDATHLEILKSLHKALKPEGKLLLGISSRDYKVRTWWLEQHWFFGALQRGLRLVKRFLVTALGKTHVQTKREFNQLTGVVHGQKSTYLGARLLEQHSFSLRLYALSELVKLLEQAGFEVMRVSETRGAAHCLVLARALKTTSIQDQ